MLSIEQRSYLDMGEAVEAAFMVLVASDLPIRERLVSSSSLMCNIREQPAFGALSTELQQRFMSLGVRFTRYGDYEATIREYTDDEINSSARSIVEFRDDFWKAGLPR